MKKIICIFLSIFLLLPSISLANSMPTYYFGSGESINDAVLLNEDCPIEVKNEVLTFDLQEFPQDYYEYGHEFNEYEGEVTAKYTFYNPTDEIITARLAFPFGNMPDYAPYDLGQDATGKWWQKKITVDGKVIEPTIRLTYCGLGDFNAYDERENLIDGYVKDDFYKPDLPVTKYTYTVQTEAKDSTNIYAYMAVDMNNANSKIIVDGIATQWNEKKKTATVGLEVINSKVEFYVLGETDFEKNWGFKDWEEEKKVDGKVTLSKSEEMTFEDFVLRNLGEGVDGEREDKYNACVSYLKECEQVNGVVAECYISYLNEELMYWYEYEVIFEPGATVENEVTAPIYPSIEVAYIPPIYEYTYLLSPAKLWNDFGELEIIIQTPAYMTECSLDGFEKTDIGYRLKRTGLPEKELEFVLSESENPKMDPDIKRYQLYWDFYFWGIPIIFIGSIVGVVLVIIRRTKKKEE